MIGRFIDKEIKSHVDLFKKLLNDAKQSRGSMLAITGETGYGKSFLMNLLAEECATRTNDFQHAIIDNLAPIGKFSVGNITPMQTFSNAIEKLMKGPEQKAKAKFMKEAGLTLLASVPLVDTVFYAVKELGRDYRQYKKDKAKEETGEFDVTQDYMDTLHSFADKKPVVLFLDDMQWTDAQSVDLLSRFAKTISKIPILIVIAFRKEALAEHALPLNKFILARKHFDKSYKEIDLQPFSRDRLSGVCRQFIPNFKVNKELENWLWDHTFGVPGAVIEYIKYMLEQKIFDDEGNVKGEISVGDYLPPSIQSTFSLSLNKISEEERNTLAICSAEGGEFTVSIVSELLNTDVLSTIRRLRRIQEKTGIIKSIGAKLRYGQKTTVYRFTQAFYHQFFEKSLEYEEYIALHSQIATVLKEKYDQAENDSIKNEIAPFLAAHSAESGDEDTAKSMLLNTARAAKKFGSVEVIQQAWDNYQTIIDEADHEIEESESSEEDEIMFRSMISRMNPAISQSDEDDAETSEEDSENESGDNTDDQSNLNETPEDFKTVRKVIVNKYHNQEFRNSAELADDFLKNNAAFLDNSEKCQLVLLSAKAYLEMGNTAQAEEHCNQVEDMFKESSVDSLTECLYLNTYATVLSAKGEYEKAYINLQEAAKQSINTAPELRLLTLANIAHILKDIDPSKAENFVQAARQLGHMIEFENFV